MKDTGKASGQRTRRPGRRKARPRLRGRDGPRGGYYAELLTAEELARLESPATLEDELHLLRTCVRRLLPRLQAAEGTDSEQKMMQSFVHLVQAIATVERVARMERGGHDGLGNSVQKAIAGLDPYRGL